MNNGSYLNVLRFLSLIEHVLRLWKLECWRILNHDYNFCRLFFNPRTRACTLKIQWSVRTDFVTQLMVIFRWLKETFRFCPLASFTWVVVVGELSRGCVKPIRIEHAFRCLVDWVGELCNVRNSIEIDLLELYHTV